MAHYAVRSAAAAAVQADAASSLSSLSNDSLQPVSAFGAIIFVSGPEVSAELVGRHRD